MLSFTKRLFFIGAFVMSTKFALAAGSKPPPGGGGSGGGSSSGEQGRWEKMVRTHGGRVVNPSSYSESPNGFRDYLIDSGVTDFSGLQLVTPNNRSAASACGLSYLLPSKSSWIKGAGLALWAQKIADVAGSRPTIRNWYRPSCYNSKVGGASSSDHITARAFDMDFSSSTARRKAQAWLCSFWRSSLNMQIGLGANTIHLGAESPYGKRNWYYSSYSDSDEGRTCFDN